MGLWRNRERACLASRRVRVRIPSPSPTVIWGLREAQREWEALTLPVKPNGTVWYLATHPSDPDFILASTVNGQVF